MKKLLALLAATTTLAAPVMAQDAITVMPVPGAFELPLAAAYLAATGRYAGVACLGAVIRGETSHYDYVCAETARGIQQIADAHQRILPGRHLLHAFLRIDQRPAQALLAFDP